MKNQTVNLKKSWRVGVCCAIYVAAAFVCNFGNGPRGSSQGSSQSLFFPFLDRQDSLDQQLLTAVTEYEFEDVHKLLIAGANPNITVNSDELVVAEPEAPGVPLLTYAFRDTNKPIILELVRSGAIVDVSGPDNGHFMFEEAIRCDDVRFLDALLTAARRQGTVRPQVLQDALCKAVADDHRRCIKYLVAQGADLNTRHLRQDTDCTEYPHRDYAKYPFYLTLAFAYNPSCVPFLLELGADPYLKDEKGKTPLDYARRQPPEDIHVIGATLFLQLKEERRQAIAAMTAKTPHTAQVEGN